MNNVVILGAGTAGTMLANKLARRLEPSQWRITVVEREDWHLYQPGLLFVPFGARRHRKPVLSLLDRNVDIALGDIDKVDTARQLVLLTDGRTLPYDQLVIATGVHPRPDLTPGMLGPQWRKSIFDFYTAGGAQALADALPGFAGGRLVIHISDMPIKCPVAPLEFAFLTDAWLRRKGLRDHTEMIYVTPLSEAFTKPVAALRLSGMLSKRNISLEPDFMVESVQGKALVSYDGRRIPFDLLVTVPINMGADYIARSGLGDEINCVPVDRHTFLANGYNNIFALGDAADLPTSKAGSVAHFAVEVFVDNFLRYVTGQPMTGRFDGHANCFIESGNGKALLIDFDYYTEPMPGRVGPLPLLRESVLNHWGKLAFRWLYWYMLLPGRRLPIPRRTERWSPRSIPRGVKPPLPIEPSK